MQDHLLGVPPLPLEIEALGRFRRQLWRSARYLVCEQVVVQLPTYHSDNGCCAQKVLCSCIRAHHALPTGPAMHAAGQVHAMLSLVRGKPTTTESVKLLLTPLEDPSMAVRCAALQKLREVLRSKREWLAQLLADSTTAVNQDAAAGETKLLAALTEALLKSCNAEVRLEHVCRPALCLLPGPCRLVPPLYL